MSRPEPASCNTRRSHAAQPTQYASVIAATCGALLPVVNGSSWIPLVRVIVVWILAVTLVVVLRCQPELIGDLLRDAFARLHRPL